MANTKSALKAWRQSVRRRMRNRSQRSALRSYIKQAEAVVAAHSLPDAEGSVRTAVRSLDKAAEKGIIHPNNAARRKSRLMKKLQVVRNEAASAAAVSEKRPAKPRRTRKSEV